MSKVKLSINSAKNGFTVEGSENNYYPYDGQLFFPFNSVIVVMDESDIITFRSTTNYDVLFSGKIGYIDIDDETVTKNNIISKFSDVANQESGGGGGGDLDNYYTKSETNALLIDKADVEDIPTDVSQLANDADYVSRESLATVATSGDYADLSNTPDLTVYAESADLATVASTGSYNDLSNTPSIPEVSDYFDGAEYDTQTKHINFLHGQTVKAYIDATAFIKDGMVDSVAISAGNLVITFNTDAGKEPITIPLTDIFNPANYYDKTTADSTFATQVVVNQEIAARIAAINGVNDALLTKADKSDTYTKTQVDSAISTAVENIDLTDYATKAELSTVATTGDYNDLSNKPTIPTVPTNVSSFVNDAGYLTQHQSLADYYTKTEVDDELATKQDASTAFSGDYNDLTNKPTIPVVPTNVSSFVNDAGYLTQHQSLAEYYTKTQVDTALAGKVSQSDFDTKEEVISNALNDLESDKQDVLISGTNIKTINNESILGSGNITISGGGTFTQEQADWNQSDSSAVDFIKNKPTIPVVPTNVSSFVNDAGYLTQHQSLANYYTKTESDGKYVTKTEYDTDEEVISRALNKLDDDKQDKLTAGTNITIQNNVISASGGTQIQSDWNQSDTTAVDFIKNKPTIPDTSNFLTINQWNKKEVAIANALTELNEEKADVSELNGKQDVLTAGQNITIQNNVISATGGTQVQSDWEENDTTDPSYIQNKPDLTVYVESSDLATVATTGDYDDLINKPTIPSLTDYYTKTESDGKYATKADFDEKEEVIATSLNGLNTAINAKQDTLVSGTSIKTINNQSLLGSGNISIDVSTKVTNGGNVATIMKITQNDYDALVQGGTVDNNTLYIIV